MILHKHYDRKLGKYVKEMVPESKEHKERSGAINKALLKHKEPTEGEINRHNHRGFMKYGKFHRNRAYND